MLLTGSFTPFHASYGVFNAIDFAQNGRQQGPDSQRTGGWHFAGLYFLHERIMQLQPGAEPSLVCRKLIQHAFQIGPADFQVRQAGFRL
ncbi:hypothetical protein D3870_19390 [Noviherbaspirillum cavernae]|uniref:Uncharacterized protein n=1 Tax=Noviherbaspirillum cavernae TaxID=2320862 RepID=A0A418WVM3_9BURK|nr:hypothetical protein D3870_19390 [Noviherbaspirillum cavernae]